MNTGLLLAPIEQEHFVFGDGQLGDAPVISDGQWDAWLPTPENQNIGIEPMACTSFALLNAVETMLRQTGVDTNLSDRFLAYASGTTHAGNDPHKVAETLRTTGDVLETDYPYTPSNDTWEKFYAIPPQSLYIKALEFVAEYAFGHSWVLSTPDNMMAALNYSPLTAGVYAWQLDPTTGYYIRPQGAVSEHDVMIYGYERNKYWKVFDSYDQNCKKLAWNFGFDAIKRYTLSRQVVNETSWQKFLAWMQQVVDSVQRTAGLGDYSRERTMGAARSSQWPAVRAAHLKIQPGCAVCGRNEDVEVHHKLPFHLHPDLELDPQNLITLCNHSLHHLWWGHLGNFKSYNAEVETDAATMLTKITTRP